MTAENLDPRVGELARALETLAEGFPDPILLVAADGTIAGATSALAVRSPLTREHVVGTHFTAWAAEADRELIAERFAEALAGRTVRFRTAGRAGDGSARAEVTYSPVRAGHRVVAVLQYAFSIGEQEERERTQREADELLRIAGGLASFGGWSLRRDTAMLGLTAQSQRILGFEGHPTVSLADAIETFAPESAEAISLAVTRCFDDGTLLDLELPISTPDGRARIIRVLGEPAEPEGRPPFSSLHGAIWDITETTAAREREALLQQRLDLTLNSLGDGLMFLDEAWRISFVNDEALHLIGKQFAELEGRSLWEAFPELEDTELEVAYQRAVREQLRTTVRTAGDADQWFDVTAYPTATGVALYIRDVTEDERTRRQMAQAQRRIADQAELIDASRDAIVVRGIDGVVHYWNRAAAELYGVSADQAIGRSIRGLVRVEDAIADEALAATLRDGYWAEEIPCTTLDGRALVIDCRWQLLPGDDGVPDRIFTVSSDVTQWRREENLRTRAKRMESLGTFAGGIAHDLNNVLTPILMSIQLLENSETDDGRRELLSTMESAAKRGADMIRQVLAFARGVEGRRERVSISSLMEELDRFAHDALPRGIRFSIEIDDDVPDTFGDETQLIQVLMNLVTNARDAMPDGGELRVTATRLVLEDGFSSEAFRMTPGQHVVIDVVDTGHGMPAEVAEKIFEPFYTTKSVGKGTGLGLASSLAIVRSHGGTMQVYSEPDRGTRFSVILPVITGEPTLERDSALPARTLPRGRGEFVLIVDDDPTIRLITSRTLESYGYRTRTAENGRVAIDLLEAPGARVDLVLTDMMMPVMDGAATTAYLEEHHPRIPVIAASGLTSAGGAARSAGMGVAAFLPKPYTTSLLLTTLRDVLDDAAGRSDDDRDRAFPEIDEVPT
ncbi:PAS domain-containing protein [Yonghaparkia sp. Root332]|uniref:PAS domain-containing protein n=1 Tax=Yonghaparkia sp. Root332 TaxID=1736516 RepID=UPI0006FD39B1|nr:PAS domain-containing protein [Yonghaparkia sp. Root332]KQV24662.1 hypothetical protein ASC54_09075 [Yonghaparkia sp. Root332]